MNDREIENFLTAPRIAVIGTIDAQGRPRSAPIWYQWEDGAAYMFTGRDTLKWRNLMRFPHASLCVDDDNPPYRYVVMDGTVEEVDRPLYEFALTNATRYYGEAEAQEFAEAYRKGDGNTVVFRLTPRSIVVHEEG